MKGFEKIAGVLHVSLDGSIALWWVTVVLVAFLACAILALVRRRSWPRPALAIFIVSAPLWALLFAWMAVSFPADPHSATAVEDAAKSTTILGILGIAALLQAATCVVFAKNQRLVASAFAACLLWFVFWVYFVAGMSVSGSWL